MMQEQVTRRDFTRLLTGSALVTMSNKVCLANESLDESPQLVFGVIADAQYCDADPAGSRYYRASVRKLTQCVEALNKQQLAFCIHLGDFIDRDFSSFDTLLPIYRQLKSPAYHVLGNHDFSVAQQHLNDVPAKLDMPSRYYAFREPGWRFIVLDGNDLSLIAHPPESSTYQESLDMHTAMKDRQAVNAQTWNGGLSRTQLRWLDQQLELADQAQEKVVIFCHFPIYPQNAHNLWNDREVIRLIESHKSVVAYMNGHNHAGNYGQKAGVHYITFPGLVETAESLAYAQLQVHSDRLQVHGSGRTPNRQLSLEGWREE